MLGSRVQTQMVSLAGKCLELSPLLQHYLTHNYKLFFYFNFVCMCALCVRAYCCKNGVSFSGTRVADGCEEAMWVLETKPVSSGGPDSVLITESSSLKPPDFVRLLV